MRILIVCSVTNGQIAPFIKEQAESLVSMGETVDYYCIRRKGIAGYLKALPGLKTTIRNLHPDMVHAHYGLSGLLANLQRKVPVVTTFHGSDINNPAVRRWSRCTIRLSYHSIFVSQKTIELAGVTDRFSLLPCGVDTTIFYPMNKAKARQLLHWKEGKKYILFAGAKENSIKNYSLAQQATETLADTELIELKGYAREEVNVLLNAADVALMTSFTEGSPQFIKEAMACNCPIVSTDEGDVKALTADVEGCLITSFDPLSVTKALQQTLQFASTKGRTEGRKRIEAKELTLDLVAKRLVDIYKKSSRNDT
jgi:teichuronic acid biosynthesis glycosyltransferase TuaC